MQKKVGMDEIKPGPRYKVMEHLGHGSYGFVVLAVDQKTNEKVAIKKMHKVEDVIDAKRMLREIRILRCLKHENVVPLKNCEYIHKEDEEFGEVYMITSLFEIDLNKVIKSRQELTDEHIQWIMYQIMRGLKYLHSASIIHRDIKPSNILATESCDVAICDFGFARDITIDFGDLTEYVVTRFYRAPEVMLSSHHYNKAVDIWSAGCTFYELISGEPLFQAKNYLDLIQLIIKVLGKPTPDEFAFIKNQHARSFLEKLPETPKKKATHGIKYENPLALDLIDKLVLFDPSKRLTAEEALKHPYFKGVHDPKDEPVFAGTIDSSFEHENKLTLQELRLLIIDEINCVKAGAGDVPIDREKIKKFLEAQKRKQLNKQIWRFVFDGWINF